MKYLLAALAFEMELLRPPPPGRFLPPAMEGRPPKRDSFLPASPSFVILEGAKDARLLIWFDVMGPNVLRLLLSMLVLNCYSFRVQSCQGSFARQDSRGTSEIAQCSIPQTLPCGSDEVPRFLSSLPDSNFRTVLQI